MRNRRLRLTVVLAAFGVAALASPCLAQEQAQDPDQQLLADAHSPVGTLRALSAPADFQTGIGDYDRTSFALNLQPYRAELLPGSHWWKMRSLAVVPVKYSPDVTQPRGGATGLGDPNISFFWSPGLIESFDIGVGPIVSVPLASDETLGSGKWSAGVSMIGVFKSGRWTVAGRANNLWSFAGDDERADVGQLLIQYIVTYQLKNTWYLISAPFITANWQAGDGEQWLIPFGGGIGKLLRRSNHAFDLQAHVYRNAVHPASDPYPDWTPRLAVQMFFLSAR